MFSYVFNKHTRPRTTLVTSQLVLSPFIYCVDLGPVHTSAFSFENAYISMRFGLPSTLIRSNTLSVFTENASI